MSNCPSSVSFLLSLSWSIADDSDDNVRSQSSAEMDLLADVAKACGRPVEELDKIWRQPSFSIANITTSSASSNKTVIPKRVTADISMRLVPDQDLKGIVAGLKRHCQETFDEIKSANTFEVSYSFSQVD